MSHLEQQAQPADCQDSNRPPICIDSGVVEIELSLIELDGGTQSRAGYDEATLAEYTEAWELAARGIFPKLCTT